MMAPERLPGDAIHHAQVVHGAEWGASRTMEFQYASFSYSSRRHDFSPVVVSPKELTAIRVRKFDFHF